jgi:hypothetical protein
MKAYGVELTAGRAGFSDWVFYRNVGDGIRTQEQYCRRTLICRSIFFAISLSVARSPDLAPWRLHRRRARNGDTPPGRDGSTAHPRRPVNYPLQASAGNANTASVAAVGTISGMQFRIIVAPWSGRHWSQHSLNCE